MTCKFVFGVFFDLICFVSCFEHFSPLHLFITVLKSWYQKNIKTFLKERCLFQSSWFVGNLLCFNSVEILLKNSEQNAQFFASSQPLFFLQKCLFIRGISFHGVYNRTVFVDLSFFFNVFLYSSFDTNQFFVLKSCQQYWRSDRGRGLSWGQRSVREAGPGLLLYSFLPMHAAPRAACPVAFLPVPICSTWDRFVCLIWQPSFGLGLGTLVCP